MVRQFVEEAKKVLKSNSITSNGNEEVASFLGSLMQDRGMKVTLQQVTHSFENFSKRQFNVIGILGDPLVDKKTRKGLLLTAHTDTVKPGLTKAWTSNPHSPFTLVQQDNRLIALGAAGGKLDLLCMIHAAEKFRERKLKQPIYIVGTCGGEMSLFGAKYLIKSLALNPRAVVVTEPTDLRIMTENKRQILLQVSLGFQLMERDARGFNRKIILKSSGRTAHAGQPARGSNAILEMVEFLSGAIANGFDLRFTELSGGDMTNQVPDEARAEFYLTAHQLEDFKRYFREVVITEHKEEAFQMELGGMGATGIRLLPDSAFLCMLEIISFLKGLENHELAQESDAQYEVPTGTVNVGVMRQGNGNISLSVDLRVLPKQNSDELEKRIFQGLSEISSRYPQFNLLCTKERMNQPFAVSEESVLLSTAREALTAADIPFGIVKKSISSDAALYSQAGYDVIGFGAGPAMGSAYEPGEWASLDAFAAATRFYERLIEKVCL